MSIQRQALIHAARLGYQHLSNIVMRERMGYAVGVVPGVLGDSDAAKIADLVEEMLKAVSAAFSAPTEQAPATIDVDALTEKIADMLHGTWHCTRVWEAWRVGTMGADDFEPVPESDTPREIAEEILRLLAAAPSAPTAVQPCPNASHMGEHACSNAAQCWEPCGQLGKSEDHVEVAAVAAPTAVQPATPVPEGMVLAPHYRGYARLGIGAYLINHSAHGEPAELVISIASEEDKAGRTVGDLKDDPTGRAIQPDEMAVRLAFESAAGLDALEQQLRLLREVHFPATVEACATPTAVKEAGGVGAQHPAEAWAYGWTQGWNAARAASPPAAQVQEAGGVDADEHLKKYGYVRGRYEKRCDTCGGFFRGGKLASTCHSCAAIRANAAQPATPVAPSDLRERLAEAHDASLDDDHKACRGILTEAMRLLDASPVAPKTLEALTDVDAFLGEVRAELVRARTKFPGDRIMTIALAEEFGELCKAVLDESAANVRKEAVQTAVMAARVVLDGDGSVREWRAERGLDALATKNGMTLGGDGA